ncbi:hypothetical protein ACHAXS_011854 [Conticribra weissflogii]
MVSRIFPVPSATTMLCICLPFAPCRAHLLPSPCHAGLSRIAPQRCRSFSTPSPTARNIVSSAIASSSLCERSHRRHLPTVTSLKYSSVDVEIASENSNEGSQTTSKISSNAHQDDVPTITEEQSTKNSNLIQSKDILPISIYAATCLVGAAIVSTYEDYDVTHIRPNPSTIRRPTYNRNISTKSPSPSPSWNYASASTLGGFNFIGAATKGMGWGPSDRGAENLEFNNPNGESEDDSYGDVGNGISSKANRIEKNYDGNFFEEWYGSSATTLQSIPSYNEIMLQHRTERIPRWNRLHFGDFSSDEFDMTGHRATTPKIEELKGAVLQLYRSLEELDDLKLMADEYMWDDMKDRLSATSSISTLNEESFANKDSTIMTLRSTLEYSMDTLKAIPSFYTSGGIDSNNNENDNNIVKIDTRELQSTIGFDWGSCAWRHCGAKADAQEAMAELYSSMGMLEPFECRFIIGGFALEV